MSITKHFMTGPIGKSEFCLLSTLNKEGLEEIRLTLFLGANH